MTKQNGRALAVAMAAIGFGAMANLAEEGAWYVPYLWALAIGIVIGAFVLWFAPYQRGRVRAAATLIYQEESELCFKEIAERWSSLLAGTDYETVLTWLVSDTWKGKFEDAWGVSQLRMPSGFSMITKGGRETFLHRDDTPATRERLFHLFARDCPKLFRWKFGREAPEFFADLDWATLTQKAPWDWLARVNILEFDESGPISIPKGTFKQRVLERIVVSRNDFEKWLVATKRKLPEGAS